MLLPQPGDQVFHDRTVRSVSVNKWDALINDPETEKMFEGLGIMNSPYIIGVVLRPMKISVFSFTSNLVWLLHEGDERSIQRSSDHAQFNNYSPSIKYFSRPINRPRLPLWYIAAFPDVIKWENEDAKEDEIFSKIYADINEDDLGDAIDCGWEDNNSIAILKKMVTNYLKNVKPYLETVV
jgi:hypothetical protein